MLERTKQIWLPEYGHDNVDHQNVGENQADMVT